MPSRRFFLKSLVGASVAYCFMPSLPLVGENASLIVDQELMGISAGYLVTPTWVMREVARGYMNSVRLVTQINRTYDPDRIDVFYGAKVKIRRPQ